MNMIIKDMIRFLRLSLGAFSFLVWAKDTGYIFPMITALIALLTFVGFTIKYAVQMIF